MKAVIDTSLFFIEYPISGELFTTPSVIEELVDLRSKCRYETLLAAGLQVISPTKASIMKISDAAQETGDAERISATDRDILALALDLNATIFSDDFAVHNVSHAIGILVHPVQQRLAKKRVWKFRCTGCRRVYRASGVCPACGSRIKRTIK
jgi:endoribonuclease Nob1